MRSFLSASILSLASAAVALQQAAPVLEQHELEALADAIRLEVEELRGARFLRPVGVELADADGLRRYLRERIELTETPESIAAQEDVARLLGLLPPGRRLLEELERLLGAQVGGFYDPAKETFYLMDSFGGDLARVILAHELVHALDDQLYDLDGTLERHGGTLDSDHALHALFEGSAMQAHGAWMLKHLKELDPELLAGGGMQLPPLDGPSFLWKPLLWAYLGGMGFLQHGQRRDKQGYLERAFREPPRSSEQVLHPEKYWDPAKRDEPRVLEFPRDELPEGWRVLHEDTLGELYLALVVEPLAERKPVDVTNPMALFALRYTRPAAEGWGGDRVLLLGKGEERVLRLATVWDSERDAREFESALRESAPAAGAGVTWTIRAAGPGAEGESPRGGAWVVLDARTGAGPAEEELPRWREVAAEASERESRAR